MQHLPIYLQNEVYRFVETANNKHTLCSTETSRFLFLRINLKIIQEALCVSLMLPIINVSLREELASRSK